MGYLPLLALCSALRAGVLSFASPKESSQRKGDPNFRGRLRRLPCSTRIRRGAAELAATRLRQSSPLFPPASALLGAADEDPKPIQAPLLRSTPKIGQKSNSVELRSVLKLPSAASSSAGRPGIKGEDCLRGAAPSSAAPRGDRAAQSTRRSRATQRARPFFAYFISARRKKVMSPVNGEKQPKTKPNP